VFAGLFSANQDGMADGLQLAKEEINSGGLAGGIPLRLILRDDGFDWDKIEKISIEFSGNPAMSAVVGYYDDSAAIKASTIYEPSRLLHLIVGRQQQRHDGARIRLPRSHHSVPATRLRVRWRRCGGPRLPEIRSDLGRGCLRGGSGLSVQTSA